MQVSHGKWLLNCVCLCGQDVCNDEAALGGLRDAALLVAKSLDDLMNHIRRGTTSMYEGTQVDWSSSVLVYQCLRFSMVHCYVQKVTCAILSTLESCLPRIYPVTVRQTQR